uniref:Polysacc_deac_1 n=1 Tax=uncultured Mesoplasma sp. TaxID=361435 RepID=A0A060BQV9_9MOLU|nr:Polysacc_deac_1 [uncultured Mesoplasma sp.]
MAIMINFLVVDKKDNCQVNRINTNKPTVMLTFDDGPGVADNDIVDILNKENVHATFFETGINLQKFHFTNKTFISEHSYLNKTMENNDNGDITKVVKKILNSGNTIGNHSFTHSKYNNDLNKFVMKLMKQIP